jgi:two-component system alkaline phosphatase synthesis response regulator PhoP
MRDGKYVILAIDDDQDFIQAVQIVLEANGYVVESAPTAEEGLRRYRSVHPDLILVDLMMEEIDAGANFAKELKLLGNQAPVFLLSGAGDSMSVSTDYTALGFSGVFQKPIDPKRLLTVLKAKLSAAS